MNLYICDFCRESHVDKEPLISLKGLELDGVVVNLAFDTPMCFWRWAMDRNPLGRKGE